MPAASVISFLVCQELLMLPKHVVKEASCMFTFKTGWRPGPDQTATVHCRVWVKTMLLWQRLVSDGSSRAGQGCFPIVFLCCICLSSMTFRYVRNQVWDQKDRPGNDRSKVSCSKPALVSGFQKLAQAQKLWMSSVKSLSVCVLCLFPSK